MSAFPATKLAPVPPIGAAIDVPYVNLSLQNASIKGELLEAVERVIDSGQYILGSEVEAFECEFAKYCETEFAIGVDNGTNALQLVLRALDIGPGHEVILPPNSFVATAGAVVAAGARPVFVDVRDDYNIDPERIDAAVTPRTRAIMPVHLTGRPADMNRILEVASKYGLSVIEDAAQAAGAEYHGRKVGGFGVAGCFSLHPLKTLSAIGDGGIITTSDAHLCARLRQLRNHGLRNRDTCDEWSVNSRLDPMQAAMLREKLYHLDRWTDARRRNANVYQDALQELVAVPKDSDHERGVYHTFVIQTDWREELIEFLNDRKIQTAVHYPIPIHLQPAAAALGYQRGDLPVAERQADRILSLPIYGELSGEQLQRVTDSIRSFYQQHRNSQAT